MSDDVERKIRQQAAKYAMDMENEINRLLIEEAAHASTSDFRREDIYEDDEGL